ncbi:hypothetical protein Tco_1406325 [Tanacetum coccineum]
MKSRFQMSSMGELTFFLGLQVKQKEDGIFISHDKSMIGSLMYLTASRPDIMFAVCACSRFQVIPKTSHLSAIKRIFRYLKDKPKLGLWYPRVSSFDLEAYSNSDYAGANIDRKSTIGGFASLYKPISIDTVLLSKSFLKYFLSFNPTKLITHDDLQSWMYLNRALNNMLAYLEKTVGYAEFHEVSDFIGEALFHASQPSFYNIPDSIPESFGGNHGGQSSSDKSLSGNERDRTLHSVAWHEECILKNKIGRKEIPRSLFEQEEISQAEPFIDGRGTEDWEAEEEVKKLAKEEAIKAALSNEYDFIQARIEADRLLALRLQD